MPNKIKYFLLFLYVLVIVSKAQAQPNDIYLDGENYIALDGPAFPSRLQWTNASKERITRDASQFPVKTYWFSHNGKSYIVINLTTGNSDIYIELGDNKSNYYFPKDFNHSLQSGTYNNIELFVENNSGVMQELAVVKGDQFSLNIVHIDPLHLKLSFNGTITPYSNTDKTELLVGDLLAPIKISGKISLSKKSPGLAHLPDTYSGCDNTIYNEMSPDFSLGQYYTPTECEQSFYKKTFIALSKALSPSIKYLASQDWNMGNVPKYKPLEHRLRDDTSNFFRTDPASGIDYDLDIAANPMKGAYHDYMQKIISLSQELGKGNPKEIKELERLQKEKSRKFKLHLQVFYNQPVQTNNQLDLSHAVIKKINEDAFLIENVENTSNRNYHNDGGTYLFIGKWNSPQFNDGYIVCSPVFQPNSKKLSIQAMYIRIGCGKEFAEKIISKINLASLQELLKIQP